VRDVGVHRPDDGRGARLEDDPGELVRHLAVEAFGGAVDGVLQREPKVKRQKAVFRSS
jgi:hypothetical protein